MRLTKCFVVLVVLVSVGQTKAIAIPVQWKVEDGGNGHWYEAVHVEGGITWTSARDAAVIEGGHLVTITSSEENEFVFSVASADSRVWHTDAFGNLIGPWLGGYQPEGSPEPNGAWRWVTAEPFDYTSWGATQPNDTFEAQDFLGFYGKGLKIPTKYWNDFGTPVTGYVVETIPEPSTLILLGIGAVGLLLYPRRRKSI